MGRGGALGRGGEHGNQAVISLSPLFSVCDSEDLQSVVNIYKTMSSPSDQVGWTPRYEQKPKDCIHLVQIHCLFFRGGNKPTVFSSGQFFFCLTRFPSWLGQYCPNPAAVVTVMLPLWGLVHFHWQYLRYSALLCSALLLYSTLPNSTLPNSTLPYADLIVIVMGRHHF